MGEMDKSPELHSKEGDNSSRFKGKTVAWEHNIVESEARTAEGRS